MMQNIPLSSLKLSTLNVRKTERDADIDSLAADIAARGLKQNLVVVKTFDNLEEYEVVAGGRRFQALQLLAKQKKIEKDWPVPCLVEESEQGVETSLAENLHRVAMNPADEFDAFRTIIAAAEGTDDERVAYCARRFGVTEKHVRGRLRLAGLAPPVLEALRTNTIGLLAAMAYASVDNPAEQERVFKANTKPGAWQPHDPRRIRDELAKKSVGVDDPKAKFVGLDAYKAAGGRTDIDLFTTDATVRLIDPSILDKLMWAAFEKQATKLAKKYKVDGVVLDTTPYGNGGKAPEGWESAYLGDEQLKKRITEKLPTMLNVRINRDGKLERGEYNRYCFIPKVDREPEPKRDEIDWDARHAEQKRRAGIQLEAFRLAFPKCAGTALDGRVLLPAPGRPSRIDETADGTGYLLQCQIRVSKEEFDACLADAEAGYDSAMAEIERVKQEQVEAAEKAKAALRDMIATPPAVIRIAVRDGLIPMFRMEDGRYHDVDLAAGDDEEDAEYGYDYLESLIDECEVAAWWATREEFLAECRANPLPDGEVEDVATFGEPATADA